MLWHNVFLFLSPIYEVKMGTIALYVRVVLNCSEPKEQHIHETIYISNHLQMYSILQYPTYKNTTRLNLFNNFTIKIKPEVRLDDICIYTYFILILVYNCSLKQRSCQGTCSMIFVQNRRRRIVL